MIFSNIPKPCASDTYTNFYKIYIPESDNIFYYVSFLFKRI